MGAGLSTRLPHEEDWVSVAVLVLFVVDEEGRALFKQDFNVVDFTE